MGILFNALVLQLCQGLKAQNIFQNLLKGLTYPRSHRHGERTNYENDIHLHDKICRIMIGGTLKAHAAEEGDEPQR